MSRLSSLHKTAFITGASTGLGRAFTEMLLAEGVKVWGTSRDSARLAGLSAAHPDHFVPLNLDLRDGVRAEAIFREADRAAGGFSLVINNAGFGAFAEFDAADFSLWHEQLQVMLVNTARLTHAALRSMRGIGNNGTRSPAAATARGTIVNISSLAAEFPLPFQAAYNVAKAGLTALNESLMIETRGTGVVIIDFRPGDYRTDFDTSVRRPQTAPPPRVARAWQAFEKMMHSGPEPKFAAADLRRALARNRSGTVRTGRFFQAVFAPFIARFGSLALKRRIQAHYFDV